MAEHAVLSASGAKKWMTCTRSARFEEQFPDEQSSYAAEGSKAHELMEILAREQFFGEVCPDLDAGFNVQMLDAVNVFIAEANAIIEPLKAAGRPFTILIEQRLDYSPWVPEGFGTGDLVIVSGHCIWVRDFKYGTGVPVPSEENYQMMLYGLGAYNELSIAYDDIREIDVGIVQPRIGNNSSWRTTLDNLLAWGDLVKPIADKAFAGEGDFVPGDHCDTGFCRGRAVCKARASACLDTTAGLASADTLSPAEIADLLPKLDGIEKWSKGLREYALKQAVDHGVNFPGYKLVEGRSNRYIADKSTARIRLTANGYPEAGFMTTPDLVSITALEELIGSKKAFTELLGDIVQKPAGKPTLVPLDDKRPEWQGSTSADDDFAD